MPTPSPKLKKQLSALPNRIERDLQTEFTTCCCGSVIFRAQNLLAGLSILPCSNPWIACCARVASLNCGLSQTVKTLGASSPWKMPLATVMPLASRFHLDCPFH